VLRGAEDKEKKREEKKEKEEEKKKKPKRDLGRKMVQRRSLL